MNKPTPYQQFKQDFYEDLGKPNVNERHHPVGHSSSRQETYIVSPERVKRVGVKNPDVSKILVPPISVSIDH